MISDIYLFVLHSELDLMDLKDFARLPGFTARSWLERTQASGVRNFNRFWISQT